MKHISIDNRQYTYVSNLASDIQYDTQKTYICQLDYLNCISVIGDNAKTFLQGQLSCDINSIDDKHFLTGLLCSLKGRIIATMDVVQCHDYQLIMAKDITDRTLSVLNKAAMLSRVQLKPSPKYSVLGIIGDATSIDLPISPPTKEVNLSLNSTACIYRLTDNMHIILVENKVADELLSQNQDRLKGSLLWHYLSIQQNLPAIYPSTQGLFLPHRLDLHQQHGIISLNKGCFRGQEIIARTHYRAKLKHQYTTFVSHSSYQLADKILIEGSEAGEIIDYCPIDDHEFLYAASIKKDMKNSIP